jgi:hypothetical protein
VVVPVLALLGTFAIATFTLLIGVAVTGKSKPTSGVTNRRHLRAGRRARPVAVLFAFLTRKPTAWQFGLRPTRFWRAAVWLGLAWLGFFAFSASGRC